MRSTFTDSRCPSCNDSGWVFYEKDGFSYARECECGIRKKDILHRKLKFANIPEAFSDVRLDNFRCDVYRRDDSRLIIDKDCKAVRWWLGEIDTMKEQGMGLYLYSSTKGSGKTRMAASIANELILSHDMSVKFATSVQILNEIKASWNKEDGLPDYIGEGVTRMTVFEIFMVVLGVVNALTAFGSLLIALFSFLDKRKEQK